MTLHFVVLCFNSILLIKNIHVEIYFKFSFISVLLNSFFVLTGYLTSFANNWSDA